MDKEFKNDLTDEEKQILDLSENESFKEEISNLQNRNLNLEDRTKRIKEILSEKNIEYTDDDIALFNDIVDYTIDKKSTLSDGQLADISAGAASALDSDLLPDDLKKKVNAAKLKVRIMSWAILGASFALGAASGIGIGALIWRRGSGTDD